MTKRTHEGLEELELRPGYLLRRAHQISSALFHSEIGDYGITTTQYGALAVLLDIQPIDQISLARLLRLDRSTTGLVIRNLEGRGLVQRGTDGDDRRRRVLQVTQAGRELFARLQQPAETARAKALAVFGEEDADRFLALLAQFVKAHEQVEPD